MQGNFLFQEINLVQHAKMEHIVGLVQHLALLALVLWGQLVIQLVDQVEHLLRLAKQIIVNPVTH
jgi:hypothetical protein